MGRSVLIPTVMLCAAPLTARAEVQVDRFLLANTGAVLTGQNPVRGTACEARADAHARTVRIRWSLGDTFFDTLPADELVPAPFWRDQLLLPMGGPLSRACELIGACERKQLVIHYGPEREIESLEFVWAGEVHDSCLIDARHLL